MGRISWLTLLTLMISLSFTSSGPVAGVARSRSRPPPTCDDYCPRQRCTVGTNDRILCLGVPPRLDDDDRRPCRCRTKSGKRCKRSKSKRKSKSKSKCRCTGDCGFRGSGKKHYRCKYKGRC
ncbi:uncharacterized protein LOC119113450 [Pollicipes pollicipes]|uniref:uncharacterized protein LOC119113450 n=1 Tax=Pollicipes pollicipes TaxID=41117 RepID=UPI0018855D67|nr:uncharacterized protein LOC119113450 [Pollicipes pollicipes]